MNYKRIPKGKTESTLIGGALFDFNTVQPSLPQRFVEDTNKYDVLRDYRQKNSLKFEPYDVKTTKYLTQQNTPTTQNIDTFLKKGQDNMNSVNSLMKNFLTQTTRQDRSEMLNDMSFGGIVRTKLFFLNNKTQTKVPKYVWSVIDYASRTVYFMSLEDTDGKYYLLTKRVDANNSNNNNMGMIQNYSSSSEFRNFLSSFEHFKTTPSNFDNFMGSRYYRKEENSAKFFQNTLIRNALLDAKEADFLTRDDLVDVEGNIKKLLGIDPSIEVKPTGVFAQKYSEFCAKQGIIDGADPNKKKNEMENQLPTVQMESYQSSELLSQKN